MLYYIDLAARVAQARPRGDAAAALELGRPFGGAIIMITIISISTIIIIVNIYIIVVIILINIIQRVIMIMWSYLSSNSTCLLVV